MSQTTEHYSARQPSLGSARSRFFRNTVPLKALPRPTGRQGNQLRAGQERGGLVELLEHAVDGTQLLRRVRPGCVGWRDEDGSHDVSRRTIRISHVSEDLRHVCQVLLAAGIVPRDVPQPFKESGAPEEIGRQVDLCASVLDLGGRGFPRWRSVRSWRGCVGAWRGPRRSWLRARC